MTRILLVLLLVALTGTVDAAGAPVAMVTDVKGAVPGAALGHTLEDGATLRLEAGTGLRLIYMRGASRGRREVIRGPATVRVGLAGSQVTPASALAVERIAASPVLAPSGALERLGGSVERSAVRLAVLPTVGAPRFAWQPSTPGVSVLRVLDGERVLWECRTSQRVVDYGGPPLLPDHRYVVTVLHPEALPAAVPFQVISEGTRRSLEEARKEALALALASPDDPTPHLLMLERYLEHDMFAEAASEARAVLDLREDEELRKALLRWQEASR